MDQLGRRTVLERLVGVFGGLTIGGSVAAVGAVPAGSQALNSPTSQNGIVADARFLAPDDFGVERRHAQPAFNQALRVAEAAGERAVTGHGRYAIEGLALGEYGKLVGVDLTLERSSGSGPLLSVASGIAGLQTTRLSVIEGVTLNGAVGGRRRGIGLEVANSATLRINGLSVTGCETGVRLDRTQFTSISNLKIYDNGVGVVVIPSAKDGGGNSLSFVHPIIVGNDVGMAFINAGNPWPQGDIVLMNPQFLGNTICALGVIGASPAMRTQLYIYGSAPEANGLQAAGKGFKAGAAETTVAGHVVPRCSLYLKNALVSIVGGAIGEYGDTNPCIILEGTTLSLHDVEGYGGPTSTFVRADAQSGVIVSGYYGCVGACHGVVAFNGHLSRTSSQGALVGTTGTVVDHDLRNDIEMPENFAAADVVDVARSTFGADVGGQYRLVAFSANKGSADGNVARVSVPVTNADRTVFALDLLADRDCTLRLALYPNEGPVYIDLKAGQPVRATYWMNHALTGQAKFCIYPTTANGPVIRMRRGQALSGRFSDASFLSAADRVAKGGYNPRIAALVPYGSAAQQPTATGYPVGAIVHNAVPLPGRPSYWQHTGNGSWKAIMLVA